MPAYDRRPKGTDPNRDRVPRVAVPESSPRAAIPTEAPRSRAALHSPTENSAPVTATGTGTSHGVALAAGGGSSLSSAVGLAVPPAPSPSTRAAVLPSRDKMDSWYKARVTGWPTDRQPPSEKDDWEAAKLFLAPTITRRRVRDLRRVHAPDHWKARGRRRLGGLPVSRTQF